MAAQETLYIHNCQPTESAVRGTRAQPVWLGMWPGSRGARRRGMSKDACAWGNLHPISVKCQQVERRNVCGRHVEFYAKVCLQNSLTTPPQFNFVTLGKSPDGFLSLGFLIC